MKTLEDLRWTPMWVTNVGCLKGCLDFLGVEVSKSWLMGVTGHAFLLNIHEQICPSGPTAWGHDPFWRLCRNAGCSLDTTLVHKDAADFAEQQKIAWDTVRRAIDDGLPCLAWEMDIPEYYVVHGYDETGYYYRGPLCDDGAGPKDWRTLADTGIGLLCVQVIRPADQVDDATAVRDALQFALDWAGPYNKWLFDHYTAGVAAYGAWIAALRDGTAPGVAYNAQVWAECRRHAVGFLAEAKQRLGGEGPELLDEAISKYQIVADNLTKVAETFPFLDVSNEE